MGKKKIASKEVISVEQLPPEPVATAEPTTAEKKSETFPAEGMVNAYGFLHLSNGVAEAFGAARGKKTPVTIDFENGALVVRKA